MPGWSVTYVISRMLQELTTNLLWIVINFFLFIKAYIRLHFRLGGLVSEHYFDQSLCLIPYLTV